MNIEELARQAGINTKFWNMGAGSVLFVSFVDGIPRSSFEHFTRLLTAEVLEQAAQKCDNMPAPAACSGVEKSLWDVATIAAGDASRAMKPTREAK